MLTTSARIDDRFRERASVQRNSIEAVLCLPIPDPPGGVVWIERAASKGPYLPEEVAFARAAAAIAGATHLRLRSAPSAAPPGRGLSHDGFVAESPAIRAALEQVAMVAPLDVDVLLTGPSGAGKTEIARLLAGNSSRRTGPFVAVNCAAIPENLFESELFGARAGAHSTATRAIAGKVEAARGGTLFLDEIGEVPLGAQAKLLQVLQERVYWPLGASEAERADVRVIAATNADLPALVKERRFREDLYWRLAVFPIQVPGLDRRREDIVPLAEAFATSASGRLKLERVPLSATTAAWLEARDWTGHLRQLRNGVEAAVIRANHEGATTIAPKHFGAAPADAPPRVFYDLTRDFQRSLLQRAMSQAGSRAEDAAAALGLARSTFYKLWREVGLSDGTRNTEGPRNGDP